MRNVLPVVCTLLASLADGGLAAGTGGSVSGSVRDEDGNPAAGASVYIRQQGAGLVRHVLAGPAGQFAVSGLPAGLYDVSVATPASYSSILKGVPLPRDGFAEFNVSLRRGKPEWTIEIDAVKVATRMSPLDNRWRALQRECDGALTRACRDLGDIHVTASRTGLARTAYKQACDQKDGLGCFGIAILSGPSPDEYIGRALPLLEAACAKGELDACVGLAHAIEDKDETRAATLLAKACDGGSGDGCFYLAALADDNEEGEALRARALSLAQGDCVRGRGRDCFLVGVLLPDGDPHAREALLKACELGQREACDSLRARSH